MTAGWGLLCVLLAVPEAKTSEGQEAGQPLAAVEASQLLERIAAELAENYRRIQLWQGVYRVTTASEVGSIRVSSSHDAPKRAGISPSSRRLLRCYFHSEDLGQFYLDVPGDRLLSRYERQGTPYYVDPATGERYPAESTRGRRQWCLLTGGQYLEFNPDRRGLVAPQDRALTIAADQSRIVTNADPAIGARRSNTSDIIDPRKLFEFGQVAFPGHLRLLAQALGRQARGESSESAQVFRTQGPAGARLVVERRMGKSSQEVCRHVLEESAGFHPVLISLGVPGVMTFRDTWKYTTRDGIRIPEEWSSEQIRGDGELVYRRRMQLVETEFPRAFRNVTFTTHDFGVHDGDLLVDQIAQQNFRFRDGVPVPPAEYIRSRRGFPGQVALLGSIAVLGAIATWCWYRSQRSAA